MRSYRWIWALAAAVLSSFATVSTESASTPLSVSLSLADEHKPALTTVEIEKDFYTEATEESGVFYSDLHPCPRACDGKQADEWDLFTSVSRLQLCLEPMLVDLALYNPLDASHTVTTLRACTQGNAETRANAAFTAPESSSANTESVPKHSSLLLHRSATECVVGEKKVADLVLSITDSNDKSKAGHEAATTTLLSHISAFFQERSNCHYKALFGYLNGTVVGAYVGHSISKPSVQTVIEAAQTLLASAAVSNITAEICNKDHGGNHVVGLAVLTDGDLATVQTRLRAWDTAVCTEPDESAPSLRVQIMAEPFHNLTGSDINSTISNSSLHSNTLRERRSVLLPRAECRTRTVEDQDDCEKLASKCGISLSDFKEYNPQNGLCTPTGLFAGMDVCCSSGSLPDRTKKPDKDGNCAAYYVKPDDNCSKIAMKYGVTPKDLEKFNTGREGTWGWSGCGSLNAYLNICVSEGRPPMPAPIPNAVCGPVKPGSTPGKTSLAEMNPCPLNACCNVWGNCGLSDDFCLDERGPTGNPGTSPEKHWGCVSNCGMEIVTSGPPTAYGRVGYYESWNFERECLYLQSKNANTDGSYTIIHWAFMEIDTNNWSPRVKDPYNQWDGFKTLAGVKKVISFGGWGYSTEPETYDILRQAMSPAHRSAFVGNVIKFLIEEDLDGVDFDWEYPGATDIDGTPAGTPEDGKNYLQFLVLMSERLRNQPPFHFTLSIAAPASFWYLKAFPIKQMARYLDYIVYMTYDLHGQWDAGNQWTSEGCPGGNCLRSHVNLTETVTALAMITKAGVPSNKIYVGEASYGRSFKMSQAGCDGPDCTFTGDRYHSEAAKGICTDTAGYISHAEIAQIIANDMTAKVWHDGASNSDLLVYDETEWVAYMTPVTKGTRRDFWKGKNFAGTIDWALDLMDYHQNDEAYGRNSDERGEFNGKTIGTRPCTETYTSLDEIEKNMDKLDMHCRDQYILAVLKTGLKDAISQHDELINGRYDHNFDLYAGAVADNMKKTVKDFMYKNGGDFFTCTVTETVDSCDHCAMPLSGDGDSRYCRYCEDFDCNHRSMICMHMPPCGGDHKVRFRELPMACPPDFSQRSTSPDKHNLIKSSTRWTLSDGKSDAFYAKLLAETAVPSDKVIWEDVRWSPALGSPAKHKNDPMYVDFNFPNPKNFKKSDVPNPKDVISEGREKLNSIISSIDDVFDKIKTQMYAGLVGDLVDALAIPIVMAQQSVINMKMANDIGKKIDDEKKKQFVMLFLTAILFFIPFIGEVAGTISALAGVARFLIILGDVGSLGMDIYSMVDSKGKDPFAIVGMIMAPLALMDVGRIAAAATLRRGMKDVEVQAIGKEAKATLDSIDRIKGRQVCSINKRNLARMELPWTSDSEISSLNTQPVMSGWR